MSHLLRIFLLSASVCWAVSGGYTVAGVNLVQNGGFETGDLTGWTTSTLAGTPNVSVISNSQGQQVSHSGNDAALFTDRAESGVITLSQTIATSVGEIYDIIFFASAVLQQTSPNPETVQVMFGGTTVTSPAQTVIPLNNNGSGSIGYTEFDYYATATTSTTLLQFTFYFSSKNPTQAIYLDDVFVAVPEPASVTMTGMACVMGLAYAWKRRRLKSSAGSESA